MLDRLNKYSIANVKVSYAWISVVFITISSILQGYFGYARDASDLFKGIIALSCWISLLFAAIRFLSLKKGLPEFKLIMLAFAGILFYSLINTILYREAFVGNTYVVMLTNMYGALNVFVVLFALLIRKPKDLRYLYNATIFLIIFGVFFLYFNYKVTIESYYLSYMLVFSAVFYPYLKLNGKALLIFGAFLSLFTFLGGARQVLFSFGYNLVIVFAYRLCSKRLCYYGSIALLVIPFVMLVYSIFNGSVLEILSAGFTEANEFNVDTRTFLYTEFFEDFLQRPLSIKLFGQGSVAYYYSSYFDYGHTIGTSMRFGIEIPVLQQIMQCGLVYFVLVVFITYKAVRRYYLIGKNSFSKIASMLIASYFCTSFISNYSGCNIGQLGYWALVGCAFCDSIITIPDKQLGRMIFARKNKAPKQLHLETIDSALNQSSTNDSKS